MAAVRERENAFVEFESDVDVDTVLGFLVCARGEFPCVCKMDEMSVESKMHFDRRAVVEDKKQIFAFALNRLDAATGKKF